MAERKSGVQYEYKFYRHDQRHEPEPKSIDEALTEFGEQGWHVVYTNDVEHRPDIWEFLLERSIDMEFEIDEREGQPATCRIWRNGVLVFNGQDHSATVQVHRG